MITKKRNVVSMSTDPPQSLEGAAEIEKPGVRFPVEMRGLARGDRLKFWILNFGLLRRCVVIIFRAWIGEL